MVHCQSVRDRHNNRCYVDGDANTISIWHAHIHYKICLSNRMHYQIYIPDPVTKYTLLVVLRIKLETV